MFLVICLCLILYVPTIDAKLYPETYIYGNAASGWATTPTNVYDNNTGTYAQAASVTGPAWTTKLIMNLTYTCNGTKIQYWASQSNAGVYTTLNITVANVTGSWLMIYSATPTEGSYQNCTFARSIYTAIGFERYRASGSTARYARMNEAQGVNASYSQPYAYSVVTSVSETTSLTSAPKCSFSLRTTETASVSLSVSVKVGKLAVLNESGTITLGTSVRVSYHVALNETEAVTVGISESANFTGKLAQTGTITLGTAVQVGYHVASSSIETVTLNCNTNAQEGISSNVTGTVSLLSSVEVGYHISLDEADSVGLDLSASTSLSGLLNETGTITLDTSIRVGYQVGMDEANSISLDVEAVQPSEGAYNVSSEVTGTITFGMTVQTGYHLASTETDFVTMTTPLVGNYSVERPETAIMSLETSVRASYHLTTTQTQTCSFTQSESSVYGKALSLMTCVELRIAINGSNLPGGLGGPNTGNPHSSIVDVFDVRIVKIAYIYRFEDFALTRSVSATMNMTNAGTISGDAVVNWWVVVEGTTDRIINRTETGYVATGQSKLLTCTFDLEKGDYVFNAQVLTIGGTSMASPAVGSLAFSVDDVYIDFIRDNYVPILVLSFFLILCVQGYRLNERRKSKSRHRKRKK